MHNGIIDDSQLNPLFKKICHGHILRLDDETSSKEVIDLPEGFPHDGRDIFVLEKPYFMYRRQLGELLSLVNPIGASAEVVSRIMDDWEVSDHLVKIHEHMML